MPRLACVKLSRQWVVYSLMRLGVFALALAILMVVGVNVYFAAIGAAVIGFCISYLFFGKQRDAVARSIVRIRATPDHDEDSDAENAALDRLERERLHNERLSDN